MVLYPNKLPESERVCSGICNISFIFKINYLQKVLRNKLTPLQIVITNGYTCSIFQVAKITRKTEITKKGVWLCSLFFKTIFRLIIDEVCIISTRYSVSFS